MPKLSKPRGGQHAKPKTDGKPLSIGQKIAAKQQGITRVPTTDVEHIVCAAGAGCGKTSTSIQGLLNWNGKPTKWEPSEEQRDIWDAMASGPVPRSVTMCAFNKAIAFEAKDELAVCNKKGWWARTISSSGWGTCNYNLKGIQLLTGKNGHKTFDIIETLTGENIRDLAKKKPGFASAVNRLTALCKQNLLDGDEEELEYLVSHHAIDIEQDIEEEVFEIVPEVLRESLSRTMVADFNDQTWLPVKLGLRPYKVEFMILDEAQDLNPCQRAYALTAAKRLMVVGDVNQAIYGFAGADVDSIPNMKEALGSYQEFPLMTTRRCGHAIVREAQRLVPEYRAHPDNHEGTVNTIMEDQWMPRVGSMVLCRINAPCISWAFKLLGKKKPVSILGREFGKELSNLVDRLTKEKDSTPVADMEAALEDYLTKEIEKLSKSKYPNESRMEVLTDKADCLRNLAKDSSTSGEVKANIDKLFTELKAKECVRFSSIHRSKGLEAPTVHILRPDLLPHPMAVQPWEKRQERNLKYVAITRAINELNYVQRPRRK